MDNISPLGKWSGNEAGTMMGVNSNQCAHMINMHHQKPRAFDPHRDLCFFHTPEKLAFKIIHHRLHAGSHVTARDQHLPHATHVFLPSLVFRSCATVYVLVCSTIGDADADSLKPHRGIPIYNIYYICKPMYACMNMYVGMHASIPMHAEASTISHVEHVKQSII